MKALQIYQLQNLFQHSCLGVRGFTYLVVWNILCEIFVEPDFDPAILSSTNHIRSNINRPVYLKDGFISVEHAAQHVVALFGTQLPGKWESFRNGFGLDSEELLALAQVL